MLNLGGEQLFVLTLISAQLLLEKNNLKYAPFLFRNLFLAVWRDSVAFLMFTNDYWLAILKSDWLAKIPFDII